MNKTVRKLALHKESLRNLTSFVLPPVQGAALFSKNPCASVQIGCTTEYTWYCPTASACTNCPICQA